LKIRNLLFVFAIFIVILTVPVSAATFSDVNEEAWYYDVVEAGVAHGYINGYEDGTFKPNGTVTKAEFYKMIAMAFGIEIPEMGKTHWAVPYARALYRDGNRNIAIYPGSFVQEIKRKDAIRDLIFAAGDIKSAIGSKCFNVETFEDMPLSTIWHYDGYILIAKLKGVVMGDDNGLVNPEQTLTRAESVALIERALAVDDWEVPEPDTLNGLNIEYIGEYSESFKESLCTALSKYPQELISSFIENNGKIIVTDEDSDKYYHFDTSISGMYFANNNEIVLFTEGRAASLFFDLTGTLVHEFAHYIYDEIVTIEDKKELKQIFNDGVEPKILSGITYDSYGETNLEEYWAELVCYQLSSKLGYKDGEVPNSINIVEKYVPQYVYSK